METEIEVRVSRKSQISFSKKYSQFISMEEFLDEMKFFLENNQKSNVLYVTSEKFTNQLINSIKEIYFVIALFISSVYILLHQLYFIQKIEKKQLFKSCNL